MSVKTDSIQDWCNEQWFRHTPDKPIDGCRIYTGEAETVFGYPIFTFSALQGWLVAWISEPDKECWRMAMATDCLKEKSYV